MKYGYGIPNNHGVEDPNDLVDLAVNAEALGFDSVWVAEHLFHSSYVAERLGDKPYHDALTVLIAVGQATSRVRLGTSVLVLPWHDPARLGKMIATLDHLSKGRVTMGVGVALTEDEFNNLGVDFKTRGRRTNEILAALQALWTQDVPEYHGEFYNYSGLKFSPKPLQKPYPPILIGGSSPAARRRTAKFGDGLHTLRQSPSQIAEAKSDIYNLARDAGRDPAKMQFSISIQVKFNDKTPPMPASERTALSGTVDDIVETIQAYEAAGLDELCLGFASPDKQYNLDSMTRFMEEVAPKV